MIRKRKIQRMILAAALCLPCASAMQAEIFAESGTDFLSAEEEADASATEDTADEAADEGENDTSDITRETVTDEDGTSHVTESTADTEDKTSDTKENTTEDLVKTTPGTLLVTFIEEETSDEGKSEAVSGSSGTDRTQSESEKEAAKSDSKTITGAAASGSGTASENEGTDAVTSVLSEDATGSGGASLSEITEDSESAADGSSSVSLETVTEILSENRKEPSVTIKNVSAATASQESVQPTVEIECEGLHSEDIRLQLLDSEGNEIAQTASFVEQDGKLVFEMDEITEDGRYTLLISGESGKGKTIDRRCTFTVNRNGSAFSCEETARGRSGEFKPVIQVYNYDDVKILSCMVNGEEASYSWDGETLTVSEDSLSDGKNSVTVVTKDGAGNISVMQPWEFQIE